MHAAGEFDVTLTPQTIDNPQALAAGIGRLSIDKRFHGPMEGHSDGEMLATRDDRESGAYVALERFKGTLHGRRGSFALVHRADMVRGVPTNWTVTVGPDSGTEELAGITGAMRIIIEDGQHSYAFEYTLPSEASAQA